MRALALLCIGLAIAPLAQAPGGPIALDARGVAIGPSTQNTAELLVPDLCAAEPWITIYLDQHHQSMPGRIAMDPDPCLGAQGDFNIAITNPNAGLDLQGQAKTLHADAGEVHFHRFVVVITGAYFGKQLVLMQ